MPEERFLTVNGLRLHYLQWGEAGKRSLLLLHASGCHAHWWDGVAPRLAEDGLVIAPDLRGHGDSGRPEPPDYRFEAYVADLAALVAARHLEDVILVGHSMGGYVGLCYAATQPAALRALVVADMLCELDGEALARLHQASTRPQPVFATREEAVQRFRLQPPETVAPPQVLRALAEQAVCQTADGTWTFKFDRRALNHPPVRVWDVLPRVACPVLVVRGEHSPLMPAANAERLARALRHGALATVPGAYHNLMLDNPAAFVQVVQDFCRRWR
ncbi:MAG: hydrolase [Candidatus Tectimicrobiota bacterium]|nr:MAG: hydrolase [Candidatus Tectomicrobia bacterium]